MNIGILSSSVRIGRQSHKVALYLQKYIIEKNLATVNLIDLNEYKFPIFEERLQYMENSSPEVVQFAERIKSADGLIIVTPEYNGGYPASLKNVIDLLYPELKRKPIAVATASNGQFGGAEVITSLVFSLWKIGAFVVPAMFLGPKVQEVYDDQGNAFDKEAAEKRTKPFIHELLWCMEASKKMSS